jgi:hypothetical protein
VAQETGEISTMAKPVPTDDGPRHVTKKCHECYIYVPLDAQVCPSCKARLGKLSDHGFAERPTDWKAYIAFFVAFLIFLVFCWFAFLK